MIETYQTVIPKFEGLRFAGMKKVLVTVKSTKICDGYKMPMIDYWEDENHIKHPVIEPINPFSVDVLENDGTYHKSVMSIEEL